MESSEGGKRIPKGYSVPPHLKHLVAWLCKTSLPVSVCTALTDWTTIFACMALGYNLWWLGWLIAVPLHLLLIFPICGRALRGIENLVHEASHFNWDRSRKTLNDYFANYLCASWVLQSVRGFRLPHLVHHVDFGSDRDPDRMRYNRMGIDAVSRQSAIRFLWYTLRQMPTYVGGFYGQFANNMKQLFVSLSMHAVLCLVGSILLTPRFWLLWVIYFGIPFVIYLPVHRFLAESAKHRYADATTEFNSTFSHLGMFQRWFLHPHGDAYHLLHHLLPGIPHGKMALAHRLLSILDPNYARGRQRTSVFSDPQ